MQLTLEQTFPLGRFHATPWKVFPYDDPHGEWPPSPWRLVRAVLARSYQLDREIANSTAAHTKLREALVRAFATSETTFQLPPSSWRGPGLRQYHPAEFKRVPSLVRKAAEFRRVPDSASEPGMTAYNTTKVLDNFWVTANGTAAPVLWHFDGANWTPPLLAHLDACLARMTYFGRAESITEIRRTEAAPSFNAPVKLSKLRSGNAVPVLALQPEATLAQLEATTDAPGVKDTNIPPGSRWMYAERPARPKVQPKRYPMPELPSTKFIQFAIGGRITPRYTDTAAFTEAFRRRMLGCYTTRLAGEPIKGGLKNAPDHIRAKAMLLTGKFPDGTPLKDHSHVHLLLHGEESLPTRLCLWRREPFNSDEIAAILDAASWPLLVKSAKHPYTLIPLDQLVPSPPGFDLQSSSSWKTLTPWIPERHVFDRKGRVRASRSPEVLLGEELLRSDCPPILKIEIGEASWTKMHTPSREQNQRTNTDMIGYEATIHFVKPFTGPLMIGRCSHFGLGLFVPIG